MKSRDFLHTHFRTINGSFVVAILTATVVAAAQSSPMSPQTPAAPQQPATAEPQSPELPAVDPRWLDRLSKEDRAALVPLLGYAPPDFTKDLNWLGAPPTDWGKLRGKVVVIQSWTTGTSAGRGWPMRVVNTLKGVDPKDVQIIALHTPENAAAAEEFMKRQTPPEQAMVIIDPVGAFCDSLGMYKQPVNFVVDRNGMVRYAGLNLNGLKEAVAELVAQPFDPKAVPPTRGAGETATPESGPTYPATTTKVTGADDLRGKRAPDLMFNQWFTREPALNRVLILAFLSESDIDRMSAHSQLNSLASQFGSRATVAAIAEESRSGLELAMSEENLRKSDFQYALALDRPSRMARAMNVTSTPHVIIISRDWIVRWQGRVGEVKQELVQQILDADVAAVATPAQTPQKRRGWVQ